jgi:hypothetical protein
MVKKFQSLFLLQSTELDGGCCPPPPSKAVPQGRRDYNRKKE